MSSVGDKVAAPTQRRPHDARATKEALLEAARGLFEEVGYERATTREIGERAGVDPALIARYFGNKESLFMAAIADPAALEGTELDYEPGALLGYLLERWDERGQTPISRALASPVLSDEVRSQVRDLLGEGIIQPAAALLEERGIEDAELRAELIVALAVGISMTRANGTLERLQGASREQILAILGPLTSLGSS